MLTAVSLNDQAVLLAYKVNDIGTDWLLPAELGSVQLSIAQN